MKFLKFLLMGLFALLMGSCVYTELNDCLSKNTDLEKTNQTLITANNNLLVLNIKLIKVNDSTVLVYNELNNNYVILQDININLTTTVNNLNSRILKLVNENDSLNIENNSLAFMFSDCQSYIAFIETILSDSTRYHIIDSVIYTLDTLPTYYLDTTLIITDTITILFYDSLIQCKPVYQAICNKDSTYSSFYKIPEEYFPTFRLRAANSWFKYGAGVMFEGWNNIKNYSKISMPDSSAYLEVTVYDSTFNNIIYHNKYSIPAIDSSAIYKLKWNSDNWVLPYDGFYYMGQFMYENRKKYNQSNV